MSSKDLTGLADETGVARSGMTVRELFEECARARVAGIPFCDAKGKIVGKASIRNILKETCIPSFFIDHVKLMGDHLDALSFPPVHEQKLFAKTIDEFIVKDFAHVSSASTLTKALASMEAHDSTYCFVIDADGTYHGVISIVHAAMRMLERNR